MRRSVDWFAERDQSTHADTLRCASMQVYRHTYRTLPPLVPLDLFPTPTESILQDEAPPTHPPLRNRHPSTLYIPLPPPPRPLTTQTPFPASS
jgi:hypothetical protein